jgi:CRP-like cAMP-binding protein
MALPLHRLPGPILAPEQEPSAMSFVSTHASREVAVIAALLARVPLFRSCTPAELADLAASAYPVTFRPGDVLCAEGADAPECYAIAEGGAMVEIAGRTIGTVGPDDIVGERGPLENRPRTATVRAVTSMVTYAISRESLLGLAGRSAAARAGMMGYVRSRYADA